MTAGVFWASSGLAAQHLFTHSNISALSLTTFRMFCAGCIMLLISIMRKEFRQDWKKAKGEHLWREIAVYAVFALFAMHYTYYESIEKGNAAAATVIQYTCPAMVVMYGAFKYRRRPGAAEMETVALAVAGTFFLVTGGDIHRITVPAACIIWGLLSAVFYGVVSVYPKHLLTRLSNDFLLTMGMFIGSAVSFAVTPDFNPSEFLDKAVLFDILWIIVCGTVLAFICFNAGLAWLSPAEATIIATVEPVAAVVFSYFLFGMTFSVGEILGVIMIVSAILVIALRGL